MSTTRFNTILALSRGSKLSIVYAGHVDGTVTGWLPAEESDFVSEVTKEPAALWHVQFDTDEVCSRMF